MRCIYCDRELDHYLLAPCKGCCKIWNEVLTELLRAQKKFPEYPEDIIHATAIMAEEAGEAVKASLDAYYGRDTIEKLRKEMIQTAAMCVRFLINLPSPEEASDEANKKAD